MRHSRTLATLALAWAATASAAHAQPSWSGQWDSHWRDGRARISMRQDGDRVSATYTPGDGRIEGRVDDTGRILRGTFREDGRRGRLTFNLSPDGQSFMGRFDSGEWWNGGRLTASGNLAPWEPDLSSPREAMRSFLISFNEIRYGGMDFVAPGLRSVRFADADLGPTDRFRVGSLLFEIFDLCVLALWDLPDSHHLRGRTEHEYALIQLGTANRFTQTFARGDDGAWRLLVPPEAELTAVRARLREARGISTPDPDAHLELRTPRDTIRTFIEQMKRWDQGGEEHVLATMDLSHVDPAIRDTEAPLLAEYLQQVLDRAGFLVWQELPNDPESRRPYVHFEHPLGRVEVAPTRDGGETRWRFTSETLRTIRPLYDAFEDLPVAEGLREVEERSTYFRLRSWFRARSPSLVERVGDLERWQAFCLLALLALAIFLGWLLASIPAWIVRKRSEAVRDRWRRASAAFVVPTALIGLGLGLHELFELLGIPPNVLWVLAAIAWVAAAFGGTWLVYSVIHRVGLSLARRAEREDSSLDEILISLVVSSLKILTIVGGLFLAADILAIPYRTVFAGLGIGGLAFAIAAQDTLANFFGSAVLLADRPFHRGDLITVGEHTGYVEHLGLRSTRIRTFDDSLVVIPNRELARQVIDNRARRRARRLVFRLGVAYHTSPRRLDALIAAFVSHYKAMDDVQEASVHAGVVGLGESSVELELSVRVLVHSYEEEVAVRHRVIVDSLRLAEDHAVELAFPTRTVHLRRDEEE